MIILPNSDFDAMAIWNLLHPLNVHKSYRNKSVIYTYTIFGILVLDNITSNRSLLYDRKDV